MNLLHPVILNLPMITQVNKREPVQVRKEKKERSLNQKKKEKNKNLKSCIGSLLVTSHVCLGFPSPPLSQAPPSGRVRVARSREEKF